jgi:SAM-dependent methyltransferase
MHFLPEPTLSSDQKQQLILQANAAAACEDYSSALTLLRTLPLQNFGELLLDIPEFHSALRAWLPRMVSDAVQLEWSGNSGLTLLKQSVDFVQSIDRACRQYLDHPLQGRILDYGCGWGRLLRLLLQYVDADQLYGSDPSDTARALFEEYRCPGHFALCDYVPRDLPFTGDFDLIYAFSVFTHLSEPTAQAVLQVLRRHVTADGMLVVTIRPPGYWDVHENWHSGFSREILLERHHKLGYAFLPHQQQPGSGDLIYGDTSMTLEYIEQHWRDWRVLGTDHNPSDAGHILVFLQPA